MSGRHHSIVGTGSMVSSQSNAPPPSHLGHPHQQPPHPHHQSHSHHPPPFHPMPLGSPAVSQAGRPGTGRSPHLPGLMASREEYNMERERDERFAHGQRDRQREYEREKERIMQLERDNQRDRERERERERERDRDRRNPPAAGLGLYEREKERERERERQERAYLEKNQQMRERPKEKNDRTDRDRERERERERAAAREADYHYSRGKDRDGDVHMHTRSNGHGQGHHQAQPLPSSSAPQSYPPGQLNGHSVYPPPPTTRHPLDISHPPHSASHLPPPPQPPARESRHQAERERERESRAQQQAQQAASVNRTPNTSQPQPMLVPMVAGSGGLTAAQVHTAIVKGTEAPLQALAQANEQTWLLIGEFALYFFLLKIHAELSVVGAVSEQLSDTDRALVAYENALRHNPMSVSALTQVAGIARSKEEFAKAIDYYQRTLNISQENGEVWGSLGHCYLMMDDLQKAYTAYQQALYRLPNPKDPKLWYGIGILYDRYGSLEHAEEAFSSVLRMEPYFEKANEIYFRLGIIYKQQHKYPASLECFRYILGHPPRPLTEVDIWFQIGHVHEQQKDYGAAKDAYERVLHDNPNHAKVLQQLGWLYHQTSASFANPDSAIQYLTKSLEADPADPQSWYLLGRAFMGGQKYNKAYEAYQQAVYRDGRNPTFWCSIGVLYYQINQYRDALDAYSRAIRLNPYISEVWFDLGSLYESCNNQVNDAIDAYVRASDLDPTNATIKNRLQLLKASQRDGTALPPPPPPQDVHPTAYASGAPSGPRPLGGPGQAPFDGAIPPAGDGQPMMNGRDLAAPPPQPAPHQESAFRGGGGPPPLQLDEGRINGRHAGMGPMDLDRNAPSDPRARASVVADADRRRMDSPAGSVARSEGPPRPSAPPGPNAVWEGRPRDAWDDRAVKDRRLAGGPSRASPAPSLGRVSDLAHSHRAGGPYDPRQEAGDRRTPGHEYGDRRVSNGSDRGPHNGASRLGPAGHPSVQGTEDRRAEMEGYPRSRAGSVGRYSQDGREYDRTREERVWRENDMRAREEAERNRRGSAMDYPPPASVISSRADLTGMASPASTHSTATAQAPDSTKKKRKPKTTPDKSSPKQTAAQKRSAIEALNASMPAPHRRHPEDSDGPSHALPVRLPSPGPPAKVTSPVKTGPVPRPSGRIIDEDYDEGAADALMGLAGYKGTKEANGSGTAYTPILPPAAPLPPVSQGTKRPAESSLSPDPKKARLESPAREETPAAAVPPASTAAANVEVLNQREIVSPTGPAAPKDLPSTSIETPKSPAPPQSAASPAAKSPIAAASPATPAPLAEKEQEKTPEKAASPAAEAMEVDALIEPEAPAVTEKEKVEEKEREKRSGSPPPPAALVAAVEVVAEAAKETIGEKDVQMEGETEKEAVVEAKEAELEDDNEEVPMDLD